MAAGLNPPLEHAPPDEPGWLPGSGAAQAERIHTGPQHLIFRAVRAGRTVVVKTVWPDGADSQAEALLRHEQALLTTVQVPGVVKLLAFEAVDGQPALILEDAGPVSLADWIRTRPRSVGASLDLAVEMAAIVAALHARDVIHRDLCPANFLLGEADRVTLIDFDRATISGVARRPPASGELEGALPYLAPEQTGRMKRLVDHRANLYALGAIFYEMFTGAPPFPSHDALEIVHAHLARVPVAPAVVSSEVPRLLSDIILKLLAKPPELRYQTAEALHADLVEARAKWRASGQSSLSSSRVWIARELALGARIYGRDKELAALHNVLSRCQAGAKEIVVLKGAAGVGKSALAQELRAGVADGSRFLAGKYDQLRGDMPLAPITDALRGLATELVDEPTAVVASWRQRLHDAVAPNGRVLTEMVPELEGLLGEQPALPLLGPEETESRARFVISSFVRALAGPDHPLVLFLDDVQWADPGTFRLLRLLALADLGHFLIVLAWREEDVGKEHPAARLLTEIVHKGVPVSELTIAPLSLGAVTELLCDAFRCPPEQASPLAEVVVGRTQGNPFFLQQFLRFLQTSGLLVFDVASGQWSWDLARIAEAPMPDDVAELLVAAARRLPPASQEALSVAACFGNQFELGPLARISNREPLEVARPLQIAVRGGLLVPLGQQAAARTSAAVGSELSASYRFAHDRVQQIAYALLSDDRRRRLHVEIGRRLLEGATGEETSERIFQAVDHLNRGTDVVQAPGERLQLVTLNERAARRAKAASAYGAALAYLRHALALLPADAATTAHPLWFRLHRSAAEAAFLADDLPGAERLIEAAWAQAGSREEQAELCAVRVVAYNMRGDFSQAIRSGRAGLRLFGLELPEGDLEAAIQSAAQVVERHLGGRTPDDLLHAPRVQQADMIALQRLLSDLLSPSWLRDQKLFRLITLLATACSLEQGHSAYTPHAYADYGIFLADVCGQYSRAHDFGRIAVELGRRQGDRETEARVLTVFAGYLNHWREPLRLSVPLMRTAAQQGIESGNFRYAAIALGFLPSLMFARGTPLGRLLPTVKEALVLNRKIGSGMTNPFLILYRQAIRSLKGATSGPRRFDDPEFDEADFLAAVAESPMALAFHASLRLEVSYLLGDFPTALLMSELAARRPEFLWGAVQFAYHFYTALTLVALAEAASAEEKQAAQGRIAPFVEMLRTWAESCPANFRHKHDLVTAELARLSGHHDEAESRYHQAIEGAGREGFTQDEGLALELCGRFHLSRGHREVARVYLAAALGAFARWEATAKVNLLEEQHRALELPDVRGHTVPALAGGARLDFVSMLKAAETLSSEVVLERLIEKLMRICIEAAGAERAVLVIQEDGLPVVRAVASGEEITQVKVPLGAHPQLPVSVLEHVRRTGEAVVLDDASRSGAFASDPDVGARALKSVLAVPIQRQTRQTGILYFENNLATHVFTQERVRIFEVLSSHIAIALDNSLLFEERVRAEATVRFLADASAVLAESLDYGVTLNKVARLTVPVFADWCVIDVVEDETLRRVAGQHADPDKEPLLQELAARYPVTWESPQPAARVMRTGQPMIVPEMSPEFLASITHDPDHARIVDALGTRTGITLPLIARRRTLGAMTFASAQPGRRYGAADLTVATELARRAAVAIDNARLYRDSQDALRSRQEFLILASHELRTPITSLKLAWHSLITHTPRPTREQEQAFAIVHRQSKRLERLVHDLLSVSEMQTGPLSLHLRDVDLADIVRTVLATLQEEIGRARCAVSLRADGPLVGHWDRQRLKDMVANLLENAIKFGSGRPVEITVAGDEDQAQLVVTDHGIGIPEERLAQLFRRFERAAPLGYGGLGLGLFVIDSIVKAMAGSIRAEPTPGGGATFTVQLPRRPPRGRMETQDERS